ncbi:MAG: RDD family protein [Verrucomicrobiota bacterium]
MDSGTRVERLDTLQRIELAEAVDVRLRVAGLPVRMLAFVIDYMVCGGIMFGAGLLLTVLGFGVGSEGVVGLYLLIWFLVRWFYNVPFEVGKKGATIGKRAMKIRVVRQTGAPVSAGQSIIRNLLRFVDEMPTFIVLFISVPTYLIGVGSIVLSKRFQRLGDLAAGTVVVYTVAKNDDDYWLPGRLAGEISASFPPLPPPVPLRREEQQDILRFRERLPVWSDARRAEIADRLLPLTEANGAEGVKKVLAMGAWIEETK